MEVLDALARAEVDAAAGAIDARMLVFEQAGILESLAGGGQGIGAVDATVLPALGFGYPTTQIEVLDLGGERGRKAPGIEVTDRSHAVASFHQGGKHLRHAVPQRGDGAHAGDNDSFSHQRCPLSAMPSPICGSPRQRTDPWA